MRIRSTRAMRRGRTAGWPAVVLPVWWNNLPAPWRRRPVGVYVRFGNTAWVWSRTPGEVSGAGRK